MNRVHPLSIFLTALASLGFAAAVVAMIAMIMNSADPSDPMRWVILGPGILSSAMASVCLGCLAVVSVLDNRRSKV